MTGLCRASPAAAPNAAPHPASPASGRGAFWRHEAPDRARDDGTGPPRSVMMCHVLSCAPPEMSCFVMVRRVSGPVATRPHPACRSSIAFRSVPFRSRRRLPPSGGSLFRAYRAPASAREGARILRRRAFRAPDTGGFELSLIAATTSPHCRPGPPVVVPDLIRDPALPAQPAGASTGWTPEQVRGDKEVLRPDSSECPRLRPTVAEPGPWHRFPSTTAGKIAPTPAQARMQGARLPSVPLSVIFAPARGEAARGCRSLLLSS